MTMTALTAHPVSELYGRPVCDCNGERIGAVDEVFYDDRLRRLDWVGVQIGFLGRHRVLVPLHGARMTECGLELGVHEDVVRSAPVVDVLALGDELEQRLYEHYGLWHEGGSCRAARFGAVGAPATSPAHAA